MTRQRLLYLLAVVILVPALACGGNKSKPAQVQLVLNAEELASARAEAVDQAEQALIDWMRDTSGAREQLGAQADEVFRHVDEARAATIQKLVRQNPQQSRARPPGLSGPVLLISLPLSTGSSHSAPGQVIANALGLLVTAPSMYANSPRDEQGNKLFPPTETDDTSTENVHTHATLQTKLIASQLEAEVEITMRAEKGGVVYEEKAAGRLRIDLCPDASGEVHLELELHGSVALEDFATQFQFTSQATGHVDDEANLAGYDVQTSADMARQPGSSGAAKGESNQYQEWNQRYTLQGLNTAHPSTSGEEINLTRGSSKVDQKFVQTSADLISKASSLGVELALRDAEELWQDGYCVQVSVPEMGSDSGKTVPPNSQTPFTAVVRHKFEGKELAVPVIAKLTSGAVSVSPSASKVPAPATFRYQAPNNAGQSATVELESRSRRGVAKLTVSFSTNGYRVDQPIPYGMISGSICSLDKPFTLQVKAALSGADWAGAYYFTPSDETSGTWSLDAVVRAAGTAGHIVGTGNYKVEGVPEGTPTIKMDATQLTVTFPEITGGASPQPPLILVLKPADDGCR